MKAASVEQAKLATALALNLRIRSSGFRKIRALSVRKMMDVTTPMLLKSLLN